MPTYLPGLFTDRYMPEFSMLSWTARVLPNTAVWGNGTVSTIVIRPTGSQSRPGRSGDYRPRLVAEAVSSEYPGPCETLANHRGKR